MKGDPLRTRARQWSRWRHRQALQAWRRQAHLDLFGDDSRSVWLCSWQRSGSTLLAQVLASSAGTRLLYEPANLPAELFTGEAAARAALPDGPGAELSSVERALHGRVRGRWVDQLSDAHLVRRRVVKDVRGIGLLGLVSARHPATPIVVLVRHPISVASSVVDLGWSSQPDGSRSDQLLAEVRRWAALHGAALQSPLAARVLVVAYEHLILEPEATLARVRGHLIAHHPTWRGADLDPAAISVPSATSFRRKGPRSASEWVGGFDLVEPGVVGAAVEILAESGLGALYGMSPLPLAPPGALDAALLSR